MTTTTCKTCGSTGPFYIDRQAKSGVTSSCQLCTKARNKKHYEENKETALARNAEWARVHKDRMHELKTKWARANAEKIVIKNAEYVRKNTEKVRAAKLAWHKNHPEKSAAISRRYQATKRSRLVSWADKQKIEEIYAAAAACGMHVDHVVPLHGKLVSGLHVHTNLRLLSPLENRKKGNRFDTTQGDCDMNEHTKVKTGFRYTIEVIDKYTGAVREREVVDNLMPMEGITHMQNVLLKGATQISTWYLGLYEGNYTPVSGDTMAAFPASATEVTDYTGTRQVFTAGTPSAGTVDNVGNEAVFEFTDTVTVYGGFMSSASAKGSTSGVLLSAVRFGSPKALGADESLRVTAGFITASA